MSHDPIFWWFVCGVVSICILSPLLLAPCQWRMRSILKSKTAEHFPPRHKIWRKLAKEDTRGVVRDYIVLTAPIFLLPRLVHWIGLFARLTELTCLITFIVALFKLDWTAVGVTFLLLMLCGFTLSRWKPKPMVRRTTRSLAKASANPTAEIQCVLGNFHKSYAEQIQASRKT
jgi:hypothetical protein